jgi:hypothetical protein
MYGTLPDVPPRTTHEQPLERAADLSRQRAPSIAF